MFVNIHRSGVLTALFGCYMAGCYIKLLATLSVHSVYTMSHHFMQSHIHRVHVCVVVTCHLHLWQSDWDLLCATAVTLGWNGYRNKLYYDSVEEPGTGT